MACVLTNAGEGYLETLRKDNVDVIWGEISKITENGLVTETGQEVEFDVLVCATGFTVQYLPHFKLTGLNGQVIQDQDGPNIYASIAHPVRNSCVQVDTLRQLLTYTYVCRAFQTIS